MSAHVRRRDTTKGAPLRILSLDGGGVRGYSMLIIIQDLMHRTFVEMHGRAPRREEIPKPADHFDLIVGTGTGGLIALMLGRLRLDLETCKELYASLTRYVFERDKRIVGIPFRSTIYKASKLEEAICSAVRDHTISTKEGNDGAEIIQSAGSSLAPGPRRHASNASVVSFSARSSSYHQPINVASPYSRYGNANARLYDSRENRTKTAVLATYQGTPKGGRPALLRSYDSRREPAPEFDCKIWEAGRATCAIGMAFKPILIGQSCFHDEGAGTFNPAPEALDEALINEWPGREVGVFISVGTGKRPRSSGNNEEWYDGFMTDLADARRKMIAKIEHCEKVHERMIAEYLPQHKVNPENYYRFNVEVGVGEFGMNEWNRLADISTGTRRYLSRDRESHSLRSAASRLARVASSIRSHRKSMSAASRASEKGSRRQSLFPTVDTEDETDELDDLPVNVMELAADVPADWASPDHSPAPSRRSYESGVGSHSNFHTASTHESRGESRNGSVHSRPGSTSHSIPTLSTGPISPISPIGDSGRMVPMPLSPQNYRTATGQDIIAIVSPDEEPLSKMGSDGLIPISTLNEGPPVPPKMPYGMFPQRTQGYSLPYPEDDTDDLMPPEVYMDSKPRYTR